MALRLMIGLHLLLSNDLGLMVADAWMPITSPLPVHFLHPQRHRHQPERSLSTRRLSTNQQLFPTKFSPSNSMEYDEDLLSSNTRRTFLMTCATTALLGGALSPTVAWADAPPQPAKAPAPTPQQPPVAAPKPPAPAAAPPKPPVVLDEKAQAEVLAKRQVEQEIAREEVKIRQEALIVRDQEFAAKEKVELVMKQTKYLETKLKALGEARVAAAKLDSKLQDTGSRTSLELELRQRESAAKSKLKIKQRELKIAEKKLKEIKTSRFEVEARYRLKVGKELPPSPAKNGKSPGGTAKKSTGEANFGTLYRAVLGGALAAAAYLSVNNRNDDGFGGGGGGGWSFGSDNDYYDSIGEDYYGNDGGGYYGDGRGDYRGNDRGGYY